MSYTRSKLQQKTKGELIDLILEISNRPEPAPEIITKEIEKLVPVEKPVPQGWKLVPEAHITNVICDYRDQIITAIKHNKKLPISIRTVVEKIINPK